MLHEVDRQIKFASDGKETNQREVKKKIQLIYEIGFGPPGKEMDAICFKLQVFYLYAIRFQQANCIMLMKLGGLSA